MKVVLQNEPKEINLHPIVLEHFGVSYVSFVPFWFFCGDGDLYKAIHLCICEFLKKSMLPYFTLTCKILIQNKVLKGVDEKLPENKKQKGVAGQGPSPTLIYLWVDMDLYFRPIFGPKTTLTQYPNRTTDPKSNHITQLDQIHSTQIGLNLIYN